MTEQIKIFLSKMGRRDKEELYEWYKHNLDYHFKKKKAIERIITEEEYVKCKRVKRAFDKMPYNDTLMVLDAGTSGFVVTTGSFEEPEINTIEFFFESEKLMERICELWKIDFLFAVVLDTPLLDLEDDEICKYLPYKLLMKMMEIICKFRDECRMIED